MNVAVWIVQGLLAAAFLAAGSAKLLQPREKLMEQQMDWVEDFEDATVKLIGSMELLAALGLILPGVIGTATVLTPIAATGLVIIQLLAVRVHIRRHEPQVLVANVVLAGLALFVALARFALSPLGQV